MIVAALFVDPRGVYSEIDGVELWDEERDARSYPGPHPVVAHPPCSRWSMPLARVNETRYGHRVGDDGGCFASALASVRTWGGVLEHPANTAAWRAFYLPRPVRGMWLRGLCGGWVCAVAQSTYGHRATKSTWLYAFGVEPPPLDWSVAPATATVSWLPNTSIVRPRLGKREAKATPRPFADLLVSIARGVHLPHGRTT